MSPKMTFRLDSPAVLPFSFPQDLLSLIDSQQPAAVPDDPGSAGRTLKGTSGSLSVDWYPEFVFHDNFSFLKLYAPVIGMQFCSMYSVFLYLKK